MTLSDSWASKQATVTRVGAAEAVLRELRSAIESGELEVGTKLPSEAARDALRREPVGGSRALRSTTALGLTETHTGKGTFVLAKTVETDRVFGNHSVDSCARPARTSRFLPPHSLPNGGRRSRWTRSAAC